MRHNRVRRKLGVTSPHRRALLRNLVRALVIRKRIRTTVAKAKEASAFADTMVEIAKRGDLHSRRLLISKLGCADTAGTLIKNIAPHFTDRKGGYTRVIRLGFRPGDGGEMALLEFTAAIAVPEKSKKAKKDKAKEVKADLPAEKPKKEKAKDKKEPETKGKVSEAKGSDKKESEKKGGFLGALRRFLKGDEESR